MKPTDFSNFCPVHPVVNRETVEMLIESMRTVGEYLLDEVATMDVLYAETFGEQTRNLHLSIQQTFKMPTGDDVPAPALVSAAEPLPRFKRRYRHRH